MTYIPSINGTPDTNNSSTSNLGSNGVFTGTSTNVVVYSTILLYITSNVDSAVNGIQVQTSSNGTTWATYTTYSYKSSTVLYKSIPVTFNFLRIVYTNGTVAQTSFTLQTILSTSTQNVNINNKSYSVLNSTSGSLTSSSTWTGTWEDVSSFAQILVNFTSTQSSTYTIQFSSDAVTADDTLGPYTLAANAINSQPVAPTRKFFRANLTNTSVSTATIKVDTLLQSVPSNTIIRVGDTVSDNSPSLLTQSILFGENTSGQYNNITADNARNLNVHISNPVTAFGEVAVANSTPVAQVLFTYGVNTNTCTTATASGGSISVTNGLASVISGTISGGTASISSRRQMVYRPGQGAIARFTALFTTGVSNTQQIAGIGDTSNGFFFGYNGTSFGILYRRGPTPTDTWIAQTSWNVDKLDGSRNSLNPSGMTLTQTNGNVYQIQYQYLGFGAIVFSVENASSGYFDTVHVIYYANNNVVPSLTNPALPLFYQSICTSGGVSVTIKTASGSLFLQGQQLFLGPKYGLDNIKTGITTLTNILTIRNKTTINTITNKSQLRLRNVSVASSSTTNNQGTATLQVILNTTLGGSPSYTSVDATNSITEFDVAGTTITGGVVKYNCSIYIKDNMTLDVTDLDIFANPTETLTFACKASISSDLSVSICWSEDL